MDRRSGQDSEPLMDIRSSGPGVVKIFGEGICPPVDFHKLMRDDDDCLPKYFKIQPHGDAMMMMYNQAGIVYTLPAESLPKEKKESLRYRDQPDVELDQGEFKFPSEFDSNQTQRELFRLMAKKKHMLTGTIGNTVVKVSK